jgi:hypothetical protein
MSPLRKQPLFIVRTIHSAGRLPSISALKRLIYILSIKDYVFKAMKQKGKDNSCHNKTFISHLI